MSEGITKSFQDQKTASSTISDRSDLKLFYPNPAAGSIEFTREVIKESGQFQLFDLNGCAVTALHTVKTGKINLTNLTKGVITSYSIHYTKLYDLL